MTRLDLALDRAGLAAAVITLALAASVTALALAPARQPATLAPGGKIGLRAAVAQVRICEAAP